MNVAITTTTTAHERNGIVDIALRCHDNYKVMFGG